MTYDALHLPSPPFFFPHPTSFTAGITEKHVSRKKLLHTPMKGMDKEAPGWWREGERGNRHG